MTTSIKKKGLLPYDPPFWKKRGPYQIQAKKRPAAFLGPTYETKSLTNLVQPSDYYLGLFFHVGNTEVAKKKIYAETVKGDFRALG